MRKTTSRILSNFHFEWRKLHNEGENIHLYFATIFLGYFYEHFNTTFIWNSCLNIFDTCIHKSHICNGAPILPITCTCFIESRCYSTCCIYLSVMKNLSIESCSPSCIGETLTPYPYMRSILGYEIRSIGLISLLPL